MEVLADRYRVILGILAVVVWVSTLASLVVLRRLRKHRPEKLAQVGIQRVGVFVPVLSNICPDGS